MLIALADVGHGVVKSGSFQRLLPRKATQSKSMLFLFPTEPPRLKPIYFTSGAVLLEASLCLLLYAFVYQSVDHHYTFNL